MLSESGTVTLGLQPHLPSVELQVESNFPSWLIQTFGETSGPSQSLPSLDQQLTLGAQKLNFVGHTEPRGNVGEHNAAPTSDSGPSMDSIQNHGGLDLNRLPIHSSPFNICQGFNNLDQQRWNNLGLQHLMGSIQESTTNKGQWMPFFKQ